MSAKVALFDTGAINDDYVSAEFVKKNYDMIKKYVVRERSVVKLADDSTHVELPGYIRAQVVFTDHLGRDHVGGCKLRILAAAPRI